MFVGGILRACLPRQEKSSSGGKPIQLQCKAWCNCSHCLSLLLEMYVLTRLNSVLTTVSFWCLGTVMQTFRFSANFAGVVVKKVIFVNRLYPLRQFRGYGRGLGVHNAYSGCLCEINR